MWGIIGTWEMVFEGIEIASKLLQNNDSVYESIEKCVINVENNPNYTSVGYGGLPNENGIVELDSSFMDGYDLSFGSLGAIKNFINPSSISKQLMKSTFNNFLTGTGAENYGLNLGFKKQNLLTESSKAFYLKHKENCQNGLNPYIGHDTVCTIGLDSKKNMATCTSTSGLFYKKPGRIGDSPIPGSGFYVNNDIGGACATGLGEDIMKGSISYEIVRLMKSGLSPQEACEKATLGLNDLLIKKRGAAGDISVISLNNKGEFGGATNIAEFPFVVSTSRLKPTIFIARYLDGIITVTEKIND